jgi:hypothetical protein
VEATMPKRRRYLGSKNAKEKMDHLIGKDTTFYQKEIAN